MKMIRDMTKIVADARAIAEAELASHYEVRDRFRKGTSDEENDKMILYIPAWVLCALLDKIKAEEKLADLLAEEADVDIERRDNVLVFQRRASPIPYQPLIATWDRQQCRECDRTFNLNDESEADAYFNGHDCGGDA